MNEWECTFIQVSYAGCAEKLAVGGIFIELYYKPENIFMWKNFQ